MDGPFGAEIIDLRSDTAVQPTPVMIDRLRGMSFADDLLEEDAATNELVARIAELFGKEAGLLTPSGSMSNQIAVMAHTSAGDEVVVGQGSHIYELERGGLAANSRVQPRVIKVDKGVYDLDSLRRSIRFPGLQSAPTALICIESTCDLNRGYVTPLENLAAVAKIAQEYSIPVYLDGARVLNSAVALDVDPLEICQHVDAVQICLNKGLGAPLGSVLAGTTEFISEARNLRQRLGGGMRHTGWIAAPALVALDSYATRLAEDHRKGHHLALAIDRIDGLRICNFPVKTNIVNIDVAPQKGTAEDVALKAAKRGVYFKVIGPQRLRAVAHSSATWTDIETASKVLEGVVR